MNAHCTYSIVHTRFIRHAAYIIANVYSGLVCLSAHKPFNVASGVASDRYDPDQSE